MKRRRLRKWAKWTCAAATGAWLMCMAVSALGQSFWKSGDTYIGLVRGGLWIMRTEANPQPPIRLDMMEPSLAYLWKSGWHCTDLFVRSEHSPERIEISIPIWIPLLLSGFVWIALWRSDVRGRRLSQAGKCPGCGYDRAGLAADSKCPECGTVPAPAAK